MITWWLKLGGNLTPGHDACTDTAGHTKAFIYQVMDHWGESQMALAHDSNHRPVGSQSNMQAPDHDDCPNLEDQLYPGIFSLLGDHLWKQPCQM